MTHLFFPGHILILCMESQSTGNNETALEHRTGVFNRITWTLHKPRGDRALSFVTSSQELPAETVLRITDDFSWAFSVQLSSRKTELQGGLRARWSGRVHWVICVSIAWAAHSGAAWRIFSRRLLTWKQRDWICLSQVGSGSRAARGQRNTHIVCLRTV